MTRVKRAEWNDQIRRVILEKQFSVSGHLVYLSTEEVGKLSTREWQQFQ
jgi:hypothetical protein